MSVGRVIRWGVVALSVAGGLWFLLRAHREREMEHLYEEAGGRAVKFHSSDDAQKAVEKLAMYSDPKSTELLLDLAMGRAEFAVLEVRTTVN